MLKEAYQPRPDGPRFDHSAFDALLRKHVDADGWVDYAGLGADAAAQSGHRRPPQEAIEACANKKADDACSFEGRDGPVEGRCFSPDDARPLACRPDRPPRSAPQ